MVSRVNLSLLKDVFFKHDVTNSDIDTLISGEAKFKGKPGRNKRFLFYGFSIVEIIKYL